jgi:hypothetical protein
MKFEDALTNPQKTEKERVNILMNHHGWKLFLKKKKVGELLWCNLGVQAKGISDFFLALYMTE